MKSVESFDAVRLDLPKRVSVYLVGLQRYRGVQPECGSVLKGKELIAFVLPGH